MNGKQARYARKKARKTMTKLFSEYVEHITIKDFIKAKVTGDYKELLEKTYENYMNFKG
jgi:hypothetical protein